MRSSYGQTQIIRKLQPSEKLKLDRMKNKINYTKDI